MYQYLIGGPETFSEYEMSNSMQCLIKNATYQYADYDNNKGDHKLMYNMKMHTNILRYMASIKGHLV